VFESDLLKVCALGKYMLHSERGLAMGASWGGGLFLEEIGMSEV
jgi:hypothetical protein